MASNGLCSPPLEPNQGKKQEWNTSFNDNSGKNTTALLNAGSQLLKATHFSNKTENPFPVLTASNSAS